MDRIKPVKIGNENFKEWLKALDPTCRVQRIGFIARTLSKMNVRGSEIKAALAQLSQRCQVMLVRLSQKEINHYTRRKPLKRLQYSTPVEISSQHRESHGADCRLSGTSITIPSKYNANQIQNYGLSSTLVDSSPKRLEPERSKSVDNPRKRKKKEDLLKELFGEDADENITHGETEVSTKDTKDKEVNNYLSTTVYVNIYDGSSENCSSVVKRKTHTEKTLIKSSSNSSKRLRIGVSLSNKDSSLFKDKKSDMQSKESYSFVEAQKGVKHVSSRNHSERKVSSELKKRSKKSRKRSPRKLSPTITVNGSDEDPSIKELWSILGLESPTERTAKYLSTSLNNSSLDTSITLHNDSGETSTTDTRGNMPKRDKNNHDRIQITNIEPAQSDCSTQFENSETAETFIKISDTFSLAISSTQSHDDVDYSNQCEDVAEKTLTRSDETNRLNQDPSGEESKNKCSTSNAIETISVDDQDNDQNIEAAELPATTSKLSNQGIDHKTKSEEGKSKIGTIRVKSLGLLMNPHLQPSSKENNTKPKSSVDVAPVSNVDQESLSNMNQQNVEERFFITYDYYFDELVESKIPKLGELLHLAIADAIRWTGRIKRAEQLSSEDLIKEEKERAEKDFSDMMKVRGIEFTPLCDVIVKRFEKSSKITLFLALFCRIFKHAGTIDTANEKYISEARKVVCLMLEKHQYKDNGILKALQNNEEDFKDQANRIIELLEKYVRENNSKGPQLSFTNTNNNGKSKFSNEISRGRDNPNFPPSGISQQRGNVVQPSSEISKGEDATASTTDASQGNASLPLTPEITQRRTVSQGKYNYSLTVTESPQRGRDAISRGSDVSQGRFNSSSGTNGVSQITENPNYCSYIISKESFNQFKKIVSNGTNSASSNKLINEKMKPGAAVNKIQNGNRPTTLVNTPTKKSPKNAIHSERQLPPVHQPTNSYQEQINSHQESQCSTTLVNQGNSTKNDGLMSKLQTALNNQAFKNPVTANRSHTIGNAVITLNNVVKGGNVSLQKGPQQIVQDIQRLVKNQNPTMKDNLILSKSKAVNDRRHSIANQQLSVTATSVYTPSTPFSLVSIPQQTPIVSTYFATRDSAPKNVNNATVLSPSDVRSNNIRHTSASQRFVTVLKQLATGTSPLVTGTLPQQLPTVTCPRQLPIVTSPIVHPSLSNVSSSATLSTINKSSIGRQELHQSEHNHTNSIPPIIARNAVGPLTPAITGIDTNQLRIRKPSEINITNSRIATPPTTSTAATTMKTPNSASPPSPLSPEITSPTAEVNLPSSSHCHPFIARRPISGKMKMLFGNNSNN